MQAPFEEKRHQQGCEPTAPVVIVGDEPWAPYNLVQLSGLLSGLYRLSDTETPLELGDEQDIAQRYHHHFVGIDHDEHQVIDQHDVRKSYSSIILAAISCHNAHKDSPRSDFKLGEVMGGVVIHLPM
jgi:NAD(P)H-nitrite reductase large subunit